MEMVAVSKMKRAVSGTLATRAYAELALKMLVSLSRSTNDHPMLLPGNGDKTLVVLFASTKGLCGGFNVVLAKAVALYAPTSSDRARVRFLTIGKNAERIAKRLKGEVVASFVDYTEEQEAHQMSGLAKLVQDEFASGVYRNVVIIYNNYVSAVSYHPVVRQLLPISAELIKNMLKDLGEDAPNAPAESTALSTIPVEYLFEPGRAQLLGAVIPQLIEVALYQAFLESMASEHSARMVAMRNATDNATEMLEDLTLSFNHARQDSITREISEISAGANALAR